MANKTTSFKSGYNTYMFGDTGNDTLLAQRPYRWGMTIHESTNNPIGANVTSTWFTSSSNRRSAVYINAWSAINNNFSNGVRNTNEISFDFVPTGQTWEIQYYIIWAITSNGGVDVLNPIYVGEFPSVITLTQLQIMYIAANNLTIEEQ